MPAPLPDPGSPTERFAAIVGWLCRGLGPASGKGQVPGPLLVMIWNRIAGIGNRFADLVKRIQEGKFRPRRSPAAPRTQPAERPKRPPPDPVTPRLPRRRAWLIRLMPVPHHVAVFGSQLQALLADPQMQALIAQAPEAMSRALRPLCWMLGVAPDPTLLPPRKRRRPERPPKPPRPPQAKPPPEPPAKPRPRGLCEPPGRYAPGAWVDRVPPHWRDVLEGTVAPRRRRSRKTT